MIFSEVRPIAADLIDSAGSGESLEPVGHENEFAQDDVDHCAVCRQFALCMLCLVQAAMCSFCLVQAVCIVHDVYRVQAAIGLACLNAE